MQNFIDDLKKRDYDVHTWLIETISRTGNFADSILNSKYPLTVDEIKEALAQDDEIKQATIVLRTHEEAAKLDEQRPREDWLAEFQEMNAAIMESNLDRLKSHMGEEDRLKSAKQQIVQLKESTTNSDIKSLLTFAITQVQIGLDNSAETVELDQVWTSLDDFIQGHGQLHANAIKRHKAKLESSINRRDYRLRKFQEWIDHVQPDT